MGNEGIKSVAAVFVQHGQHTIILIEPKISFARITNFCYYYRGVAYADTKTASRGGGIGRRARLRA